MASIFKAQNNLWWQLFYKSRVTFLWKKVTKKPPEIDYTPISGLYFDLAFVV
jgi:hypothetical protein